ncbi:Phosphatidylserine synthase [Mycena kentingensis (nom. inval.)]|nr:Phosphatidylserine synthase [Mycena kentingensis (nom. inval.)]
MKALFGRKQSEKQPSATSRTLNEAYKIWLPRPELPRQRTTSGSAARPPDVQHQTRHPPPTAAAYRPQYYTGAGASTPVVQPPQQLPPRPDSRASYVQYNPVYAQPYPQQRVPAPVSAPPPVAGSSKQPRPRREGSTSSLTLKRGDAAAEPKKSSKHHRSKDKEAAAPPPEVRKRKDSSSRDKERDKDRVASRKREDKERERDRMREKDKEKERRRREEAEYSDARPSSRAAKLFQRLEETKKGKPPDRTRTGIPTQPTTGSSSSGKQTPQIPRMPIYLPTSKSQRDNGLSESDTDNPLSRGRSTLPKSFSKTVTVPLPSPTENKVKESKSSFWSFRTRSSQKFAQPVPVTTSSRKPRADSTPPQPVPTTTERPHRRYASDSTIGAKPDRDSRLMATELRPTTSADRSGSRTMAFATQPDQESILKTPSSLAHSVLHPTVSRSSMSSEIKKKGILNMFRSPAPAPRMEREVSASDGEYMDRPRRSKQHIPAPINIPANGTVPISERKSPNARVFTPFRILSNKRRRRVSTASMDAVNGTAPNTVMGSPTASMQSSQFPSQPPPHRDPMTATHDWRNHAETKVNIIGKARRMRPGVVFDTPEDPMEESRPKLRGRRTSGGSASASDGQGTDSSE